MSRRDRFVWNPEDVEFADEDEMPGEKQESPSAVESPLSDTSPGE